MNGTASTKRPVIAWSSLPLRLPLAGPLAIGLLLDRISAPAWLCGVVALLVAFWWFTVVASWGWSEPVDVAPAVRDLAVVVTQQSRDTDRCPGAVEAKEVGH